MHTEKFDRLVLVSCPGPCSDGKQCCWLCLGLSPPEILDAKDEKRHQPSFPTDFICTRDRMEGRRAGFSSHSLTMGNKNWNLKLLDPLTSSEQYWYLIGMVTSYSWVCFKDYKKKIKFLMYVRITRTYVCAFMRVWSQRCQSP